MKPACLNTIMSNMWFGLMEFKKAGDFVKGHKHLFNHCTLLSYGTFRVVKFDLLGVVELDEIIEAPCIIHIEKGQEHSIEAKSDGAVACCCHAIYEDEQSLFPVHTDDVPIVGGTLKLSLLENSEI